MQLRNNLISKYNINSHRSQKNTAESKITSNQYSSNKQKLFNPLKFNYPNGFQQIQPRNYPKAQKPEMNSAYTNPNHDEVNPNNYNSLKSEGGYQFYRVNRNPHTNPERMARRSYIPPGKKNHLNTHNLSVSSHVSKAIMSRNPLQCRLGQKTQKSVKNEYGFSNRSLMGSNKRFTRSSFRNKIQHIQKFNGDNRVTPTKPRSYLVLRNTNDQFHFKQGASDYYNPHEPNNLGNRSRISSFTSQNSQVPSHYQGFKLLNNATPQNNSHGITLMDYQTQEKMANSTVSGGKFNPLDVNISNVRTPTKNNPSLYSSNKKFLSNRDTSLRVGPNLTVKNSTKDYERMIPILSRRMRNCYPSNLKRPPKCICGVHIGETCYRGLRWLKKKFRDREELEQSVQKYFDILDKNKVTEKDQKQIEHDLPRTFPEIPFFKKGSIGYEQLRNILHAVSVYFEGIGYVQGMNFIAACFLYHVDEVYAFWMFVYLIESLDMKDIYVHGLPGLKRHCRIFKKVLEANDPELDAKLDSLGVIPEIYVTEWLIAFACYIIDFDKIVDYFDFIFEQKFIFFYKLLLEYMKVLKPVLMKSDEMEAIEYIKQTNGRARSHNKDEGQAINWGVLMRKAKRATLQNHGTVQWMLTRKEGQFPQNHLSNLETYNNYLPQLNEAKISSRLALFRALEFEMNTINAYKKN